MLLVIGRKDLAYQYLKELKKAKQTHQDLLTQETTLCPCFSPADKILDTALEGLYMKIARYEAAVAYTNTSLRTRAAGDHPRSQVQALGRLNHVKTLFLNESATFAQTIVTTVRERLKTRHEGQSIKTFKQDGYEPNEDLYSQLNQLVDACYGEIKALFDKADKKARSWAILLSDEDRRKSKSFEHLNKKFQQLKAFRDELVGIENVYKGDDSDRLFQKAFFYPRLVKEAQTRFLPGEDITQKTCNTPEWTRGIFKLAEAVANSSTGVNQSSFVRILESAIRRLVPLDLRVHSVAMNAFSRIGAMHHAMVGGHFPSLAGRVTVLSS